VKKQIIRREEKVLIDEFRKAKRTQLLSYEEGKAVFKKLRKKLLRIPKRKT